MKTRKFHNKSRMPLYFTWKRIRQRCRNTNNEKYKYYAGKGISVCEEWEDFSVFEKWALNNGYESTLTIDRINSKGNYEPSNCRWVTMSIQANNKSNNKFIEYKGERLSYAQWSYKLNGNRLLVQGRIRNGWSEIEAVSIPKGVLPDRFQKGNEVWKKSSALMYGRAGKKAKI